MRIISKSATMLFTVVTVIIVMKIFEFRRSSVKSELEKNMTLFESAHEEPPALLTIFTTFEEIKITPHHELVQGLVLTNWPLFKPYVRPVLFLNFENSSMAVRARAAGWEVLGVNRSNPLGVPYLKDMFKTVFERYDSLLYGYAYGDLLFDGGLRKTLDAVKRVSTSLDDNILMAGRRTNVMVTPKDSRSSQDFFAMEKLHPLAIKNGSLVHVTAIDYFFFSKQGCSLDWSSLFDIVVGRPAHDSYLVSMATLQGVNVIDCTVTLLAVHISQTGISTHDTRNTDEWLNAHQSGCFRRQHSFPMNAKFSTIVDFEGHTFVIQRQNSRKPTGGN